MWVVGLIVGAVLGAVIDRDLWLLGAVAGAVIGLLISKRIDASSAQARLSERELGERLERLERLADDMVELKRRLAALETAQPLAPDVSPPMQAPPAQVELDLPPPTASVNAPPVVESFVQPVDLPPTTPVPPLARPTLHPALQWLLGGNTVVRVGIVILFFGIAFLLKYTYEHAYVPLSLRLTGVAVGALALLVVGWRLRRRRPDYALPLQGGGVGLLYLTIFAAFRLYRLLAATPAFALMVVIVGFSAALAVLQDSLALAAFGVAGGFLAPLLTSTGQGSHVMLFSYYLLLNLGVFGIAWFKSWRVLNVLGFLFSFVIGAIWGWKFYGPPYFASTEPFLIAFFLLYVAIPCLFARRQALELKKYVDGTLVFGVPLAAFGLQCGLVKEIEYGAAWSALALAGFYITITWLLWRGAASRLRLLAESFLVLGIGFATLTLPLAFDGRVTAAAWAVEGAAIVWVGVRQQRLFARSVGIALQFMAGYAFLLATNKGASALPILNSGFISGAMLTFGALFCSAYLARHADKLTEWESPFAAILLGWGVLWWSGIGLHEIDRYVAADYRSHLGQLFLVASAALFGVVSRALAWPLARWPAYAIAPLGAVFVLIDFDRIPHPAQDLGFATWPAIFLLHLWTLRRSQGGEARLHAIWHALGVCWLALVAAWELAWQIDQAVDGRHVWPAIAWAIVPCAMLAAVSSAALRRRWPLADWRDSYLDFGAYPLAGFLCLWSLATNLAGSGNPAPLPYLPLLNPLDLAQGLVVATLLNWHFLRRRLGYNFICGATSTPTYTLIGVMLFVWANGIVLRTLHHWAGVPFDLASMARSVLVQAALSLLWTTLALLLMATAARRAWRTLWMVGAGLMAVVVAKLFLIDLSNIDGIERIVSFIGVGVLMLVVGYVAPLPPKLGDAA